MLTNPFEDEGVDEFVGEEDAELLGNVDVGDELLKISRGRLDDLSRHFLRDLSLTFLQELLFCCCNSLMASSFHREVDRSGTEDLVVLPDKSQVDEETVSSSRGMKMQEKRLKNSWFRLEVGDEGFTDTILGRVSIQS